MALRTNITKDDVAQNMLEIALYLAQNEKEMNTVDITVKNLHMHFEAWTDEAEQALKQMGE